MYKRNLTDDNHHSQHPGNGVKIVRNMEEKEALEDHQDGQTSFKRELNRTD